MADVLMRFLPSFFFLFFWSNFVHEKIHLYLLVPYLIKFNRTPLDEASVPLKSEEIYLAVMEIKYVTGGIICSGCLLDTLSILSQINDMQKHYHTNGALMGESFLGGCFLIAPFGFFQLFLLLKVSLLWLKFLVATSHREVFLAGTVTLQTNITLYTIQNIRITCSELPIN